DSRKGMLPPPAAASRVDHNYVDDLLIEFDLVFDDEDPLGLRRGLRFGCHPSPLRWNRDASRSDQSNDDAAALGHATHQGSAPGAVVRFGRTDGSYHGTSNTWPGARIPEFECDPVGSRRATSGL